MDEVEEFEAATVEIEFVVPPSNNDDDDEGPEFYVNAGDDGDGDNDDGDDDNFKGQEDQQVHYVNVVQDDDDEDNCDGGHVQGDGDDDGALDDETGTIGMATAADVEVAEEFSCCKGRLDSFGLELKLILAEVTIITSWIQRQFGIQLINQNSLLFKHIYDLDEIEEIALGMSFPVELQSHISVKPPPAVAKHSASPRGSRGKTAAVAMATATATSGKPAASGGGRGGGGRRKVGRPKKSATAADSTVTGRTTTTTTKRSKVGRQGQDLAEDLEDREDDDDGHGHFGHSSAAAADNIDDHDVVTVVVTGGVMSEEWNPQDFVEAVFDKNLPVASISASAAASTSTSPSGRPRRTSTRKVNYNETGGEISSHADEHLLTTSGASAFREGLQVDGGALRGHGHDLSLSDDADYLQEEGLEPSTPSSSAETQTLTHPSTATTTSPKKPRTTRRKKPKASGDDEDDIVESDKTEAGGGGGAPGPAKRKRAPANKGRQDTWESKGPKQCDECGKVVMGTSSLKKHKMMHADERPYACPECGKTFRDKKNVKIHLIALHNGERHLQCSFCGRKFYAPKDLRIHERTHTGDKPYPCHLCEKRFNVKEHLTMHIRVHTGERPYSCPTCAKTFSQANSLRIHKKIHLKNAAAEAGAAEKAPRRARARKPKNGGAEIAAITVAPPPPPAVVVQRIPLGSSVVPKMGEFHADLKPEATTAAMFAAHGGFPQAPPLSLAAQQAHAAHQQHLLADLQSQQQHKFAAAGGNIGGAGTATGSGVGGLNWRIPPFYDHQQRQPYVLDHHEQQQQQQVAANLSTRPNSAPVGGGVGGTEASPISASATTATNSAAQAQAQQDNLSFPLHDPRYFYM